MPKLIKQSADPFEQPTNLWHDAPGGLTLHRGNVFDVLPRLLAKSVHCCVTSPPYWGLRDYKTGTWVGGDAACDHVRDFQPRSERANPSASGIGRGGDYADEQAKASAAYRDVCGKCGARRVDEQLGAEPSPDCGTHGQAQCGRCYVCQTVRWCREVMRVLRDDGIFWLNIGDTYCGGSGGNNSQKQNSNPGSRHQNQAHTVRPLPQGNLIGVPWRVAIALQADGWVLRSECPWFKRNSMPESADTRPGKSLEYVFMLTKSMDYFFDMEAVRVPALTDPIRAITPKMVAAGRMSLNRDSYETNSSGRNFRNSDLWFESVDSPHGLCGVGDELLGLDVTINGFKVAHFATFNPQLITPLIKASTSDHGCCVRCGAPWQRMLDKERVATRPGLDTKVIANGERAANDVTGNRDPERHVTRTRTVGWEPMCCCGPDAGVKRCVVLEPFSGSGTTLATCSDLGRHCVGVELSEEYFAMAVERLERKLHYAKHRAAAPLAVPEYVDPFA